MPFVAPVYRLASPEDAVAAPLLNSPNGSANKRSRVVFGSCRLCAQQVRKPLPVRESALTLTNLQLHFPPAVSYSTRYAFSGDSGKGWDAPMTTPTLRVERRAGQRFPYLLPVSLRECATSTEGVGFTQDLSSRGVFFFTDAPLLEGAEIELTLRMPSEITLGESMPVRCRGRILRIVRPAHRSLLDGSGTARTDMKIGVAVRLECYEYLAESAASVISRVATVHHETVHHEEQRPRPQSSSRPVLS
jgi:hypothetical protein